MKRKLMLFVTCLFIGIGLVNAQIKVTGTVTSSEDGLPVVGASVIVKGTTIGTVTDLNGNFTLPNVPETAKQLQFSFVGMKTQLLPVKSKMNVLLHSDREVLDEVMVVAFGTAKKSSFTGSASALKGEKIAQRQTSNVTNALAGQVAGVQIQNTNGAPGSGATVRIRGIGSMAASNEPLYVVDGVPFDGGIETINPQDIESMTVLKDAASNALYGARGANGVILITTKKGQVGTRTQVTLDAKWGTNRRAVPNYDVMTDPNMYYETYYKGIQRASKNPNDYVTIGQEVQKSLGYPIYDLHGEQNLFTPEGKINPKATIGTIYNDEYYLQPDNWYDELFDNGNLRQEYNLRISGASEKMTYYLSAGYLDETGIIPSSGFKRFTLRSNVEYQVTNRLRVGTNISYSNSLSENPRDQEGASTGNLFYVSNNIAPIYPLYVRNADKSIRIDNHGYQVYDFGAGEYKGLGRPFMGNSNPASMIALDANENAYDVIGARGFAKLDIWKGLRASASWGYDLDNTRTLTKYNAYYGQYAGETGGIIYIGSYRTQGINQQYLLTYNEQFGKHNIDAMAGYESYQYKYQTMRGKKEKLYNPNVNEINNAINNPSINSSTDTYKTQGILARLQYNYDDKYFGSVSFRRDASSRFHPDNRWGNFWSIGGGWLINKENFMQNATWIDMLKYKASYGVQGNDNIGNYYAYQDQFEVQNNNGDFGLVFVYKGNKDITWETSKSFNTGFDFEFFKNRIGGSFEYFSRKTSDMLYKRPVPPTLGYSTIPTNIGSMVNSGVELDIHGDLIRNRNLTWSMNFNLTHVKNEIKELAPELEGELIDGSRIYQEGKSMYQSYLRSYAGVDKETGDALYYIDKKDENGNVIGRETTTEWSQATRYASGDLLPKVYGGFGTQLNAYGFDFSIALAYQLGGTVYDNTYQGLMHAGESDSAGQNWHKDILNAWTPENPNSNIPAVNYNAQYANRISDRFLVSSDYLSINNITLGYTLPKNWIRNFASSVRLYLAADNVALITARKGLDPRQGYFGTGNDTYSMMRTISGGISVTF